MNLSREQAAVWNRQQSNSHSLNIPVTARFFGLVDKDVLTAAVRDVIRRHEILRTVFTINDDVVVNKHSPLQFPHSKVLDASDAPELSLRDVDSRSMAQIFNAAVDYKFDLTRETPVRVHLFSVNQSEHTLLFVFHRIAFDGRSISPLMRDLFEFYSARIEKRETNLPPMLMQYADYARMQNAGMENIADSGKATNSKDEDLTSKGIVPLRINPGLHDRLRAFAKESDVSVNAVLYAGFAVFLARLDLDDKAGLCTLNSSRDHFPDTLPLIGNFETVQSVEIDVQGNQTFLEVVKRMARAETAQDVVHIEKASITVKTPYHFSALFRVNLIGMETLEFPMLKVFINPAPVTETGFELVFDLSERLSTDGKAQGLEGSVIFDRNVFAPRHMPVRLDWMMTMLKHGVLNPNVTIDELPPEEKLKVWEKVALAPECRATAPERVATVKIAMVQDNGRHERVPLTDSSAVSAIAVAPAWQQSYVAFQDALQCQLSEIWEEALGVSRVGTRDRFVDLGGDAGQARRVVATINRVFRKKLPTSLMCGGATVESLASAIFRELSFEPITTVQPESPGSKPPLFFIHGDVFGGGLYTIELSRCLGSDIPLVTFNPHGLDGQDIPESIEKMAEDYLRILKTIRPYGSFYLGGFCNGALIAYEMARIIEREGQSLQTPVLMVETPTGDISEMFSQPVANQEVRPTKPPVVPSGSPMGATIHKAWVLNEMFRLSGIYRPGRYAGPVVVIQPEKSLSNGTLVRSVWEKVADNIRFFVTPGDHITCIGRHVPELAEILKKFMDEQGGYSSTSCTCTF